MGEEEPRLPRPQTGREAGQRGVLRDAARPVAAEVVDADDGEHGAVDAHLGARVPEHGEVREPAERRGHGGGARVDVVVPERHEHPAWRAQTGATILMASHNMSEVERLCSEVMMMKAGRIVDRGSPRALIDRYGRTNLEEVFLHIARERRIALEPAK